MRFRITILLLLLITLAHANPRKVEVKPYNGAPALYVDGEPYPPFAYMSYFGETEYYKQAAEAGIHLYCFPAYLGDRGINTKSGIGPFRPAIWQAAYTMDYSSIITDFKKVLEADPKAMVIIRLHLDPPAWWETAHPEACRQLPDGSTFRQCFASDQWRNATGKVLREIVHWLLASDYWDNLVGIHLAAGGTEEWFYHINDYYEDVNPSVAVMFRLWLREKYGSPDSLQKSWKNDTVDFRSAIPADISGRVREERWRNPETEQRVLDTFRFHTQTLVDNIIYFCQLVKEFSNGELLTGAFYGYQYFVTDARRGHGPMSKLLDCEDLDFLSSPNVYDRVMGEDWPPMSAVQSVQLHGKLWLAENDTRTFKTGLLKDRKPEVAPAGQYESGVWIGPAGVDESVALLRKNSTRMLAYNYGGWWFDMWGGWFDSPELLQVLKDTQTLWQMTAAEPDTHLQSQICVLVDEELAFYDASYGKLAGEILANRSALGKTGAPYDLYLISDWDRLPKSQYRLIWLLGVPELSAQERISFSERDAMVIWTNTTTTRVLAPEPGPVMERVRFTPETLRQWIKQAGVHSYLYSEDVLYAGNGWLSVHTIAGGEREIRLPFTASVKAPLQNKVISDSCEQFSIDLPANSSTILRVNAVESN